MTFSQRVRSAGIVAIAMGLCALAPQAASAQGLLDALFGGFGHQGRSLPPQASSFANPFDFGSGGERRSSGEYSGGGGQAYCVRTCDGRPFPLQRNAHMSPIELCKSFCPASKTMVFYGGKIDTASSGGTRYADLDNAFVYKEKLVDGCTCNGKDPVGLAQVSVVTDPTLRAGDIIATNDGLQTVRNGGGSKTAEFTPVSASQLGKQWAGLKVSPQPEPQKIEPVAEETPAPKAKKKPVRSQSAQNYRPAQRSTGLFGFPF
ncbi:MAG: DUF2865 domain-containing protein [Pseudomonadota bacterium]